MSTLPYLLPLGAAIVLLASGRVPLLLAGLGGLILTVPVAFLAHGGDGFAPFALAEAARGAWIAWQAIAVVIGGLLFYQVIRAAEPELFEGDGGAAAGPVLSHRGLFAICFLVGPFAESATGFGVGAVIAASLLARSGLRGAPAVAFALYSQILVPWGALAIGTVVGAALIHMPLAALGMRSALLSVPILVAELAVFWSLAARFCAPASAKEKLDDLLWLAALLALLAAANRYASVEVAGVAATGLLLPLRYLRDARPSLAAARRAVAQAAPYLALTLLLLATRLVAPLAAVLRGAWAIQPYGDLPAFAPLHHASVVLVAVALCYGGAMGALRRWRDILARLWRSARTPVAVTLVFVVMAQLMAAAGIAQRLAEGWSDVAGPLALAATPLFGAAAGFLTGSNVASNGMMLPLQAALAASAGADPTWIAAVQNVAGSDFTLLSPIRVAMATALLGLVRTEREIYRLLAPLAATVILVLLAAALLARL
jgi:lactate permease